MDKDLFSLIATLIKGSYITMTDLESELKNTRRQLTYRLEKINFLLKSQNLPLIEIGEQKEILLKPETKKFLAELLGKPPNVKQYYFNKKERISFIFLMLFIHKEFLSIQHFISSLKASRSTILLDLKELKQELAKIKVKLNYNRVDGYYLSGPELEIRGFMIKLVQSILEDENSSLVLDAVIEEYNLEPYESSKNIITQLAEKYGINFVGNRLDEFIYIFTFLHARINNEANSSLNMAEFPNLEMIEKLNEYRFTEELLKYYKRAPAFNKEEYVYLSAWIIAISVGNIKEETPDKEFLSKIVEHIMVRYEILSGTHYKEDREIFKQLYSHIRPAYYRVIFRLPIYNPLCGKIKEQYRDLYRLVKETIKPLEGLFHGEIPEEEIAYLTMHFASIYSGSNDYEHLDRKRALVVCSNGIGSSAILYNELKELFPELYFYPPIDSYALQSFKDPVDIIFTTQYQSQWNFLGSDVPIVTIAPIINPKERYALVQRVYSLLGLTSFSKPNIESMMEIIERHATIHNREQLYHDLLDSFRMHPIIKTKEQSSYRLIDLVSEDMIKLKIDVDDWRDALRISGNPLVKRNIISPIYIEKIIEKFEPYFVIAPLVALPHTRPENGAFSYAIGITTLQEPIEFGYCNLPVKYIFFLSSLDSKRHLPAMCDLLNLLNQPEFFNMLDQAEDPKNVLDYIRKYSAANFQ
jgi:PRD domain./Mga helix-turn-helix domain./Phosphoenolpyruvate-dependent sugar phosphotransferase system, EIIA 2.